MLSAAVLSLAVLAAGLRAQGPSLPAACAGDVEAFCAESRSRGLEAELSCLKVHGGDVSQACRDALGKEKPKKKAKKRSAASAKEALRKVSRACSNELQMLCYKAGKGSRPDCLYKHLGDATAACRRALIEEKAVLRPRGRSGG